MHMNTQMGALGRMVNAEMHQNQNFQCEKQTHQIRAQISHMIAMIVKILLWICKTEWRK